MNYGAVGKRIAVILGSLKLPMSDEEALELLRLKGFKALDVDIIALARQNLGKSQYVRGVSVSKAPKVIDCSSFTKWLFAQRGIWLPRRSVQQRRFGLPVEPEEIAPLDLIFATGFKNYYVDDEAEGVGHVGIVTDTDTVIHCASPALGLIESPVESFTMSVKFRGARRYIPPGSRLLTFEIPPGVDIETSDDIRWTLVPPV
ncbi:MAG: NlpC/P60 family protein [Syntrophobacteraceae bacterium]